MEVAARLEGDLGERIVIIRSGAPLPLGSDTSPVEPRQLVSLLRKWLSDRRSRAELCALHARLRHLPEAPITWASIDICDTVGRELESQLACRALVGYRLRSSTAGGGMPQPGRKQPTKPPAQPVTTFIELCMADTLGRPSAGEPFALTLVDGSVRHGALDTKGVARLERLEAGLCTVTFPRIDAREHGFRGALPPQSEEGDGIKTYHRARDTEWTGHIAQAHRFRDYNTVWLHPANQAIRARRVPEMLRAGDVIAVPAFTTRSFDVVTGQRHDFEVRVGTVRIHLQLHDIDDEPLAGAQYELQADGVTLIEGATTAGDGSLQHLIPQNTNEVRVVLSDRVFEVCVGGLSPVDDDAGASVRSIQERLANLGYGPGPCDGVLGPRTRRALREFHRDAGLPADTPLEAAAEALVGAHGS